MRRKNNKKKEQEYILEYTVPENREKKIKLELEIPESLHKDLSTLAGKCKTSVELYCKTILYQDRDLNDIFLEEGDDDNRFIKKLREALSVDFDIEQ